MQGLKIWWTAAYVPSLPHSHPEHCWKARLRSLVQMMSQEQHSYFGFAHKWLSLLSSMLLFTVLATVSFFSVPPTSCQMKAFCIVQMFWEFKKAFCVHVCVCLATDHYRMFNMNENESEKKSPCFIPACEMQTNTNVIWTRVIRDIINNDLSIARRVRLNLITSMHMHMHILDNEMICSTKSWV